MGGLNIPSPRQEALCSQELLGPRTRDPPSWVEAKAGRVHSSLPVLDFEEAVEKLRFGHSAMNMGFFFFQVDFFFLKMRPSRFGKWAKRGRIFDFLIDPL